jgi:NTP pyrophosphatase (non-canonical NTP hydrolase)
MKTWDELAEEINTWALRNYGVSSTPWQLMLGVIEEVGEFYEARNLNDLNAMFDSFGDQAIYALNLCKTVGIPATFISAGRYRVIIEADLLRSMGTGARGILKNSQGIRGMGEVQMKDHMVGFINVWGMWTTYQLELYSLKPLIEITNIVWSRVSKRDWKTNPITGI